MSSHVKPSSNAPNVYPSVVVNPLTNVWLNFVFVDWLSTVIFSNFKFETFTSPLLIPMSSVLDSSEIVAKNPTPICSPTSSSPVCVTVTLEITGFSVSVIALPSSFQSFSSAFALAPINVPWNINGVQFSLDKSISRKII